MIASATSDPRARPGRRSSPGGRSGFGERRWMRAKRTSSRRPPPTGRTHPRLSPSSTAPRPRVKVSAPGRSSPPSPRGSSEGNTRPASAAPASPIGTLTANTHSQPGPLVIRPPSTQPDAPPPAAAAVQIASARGGRRRRARSRRAARAPTARTSAAPAPCTARAAISAAAVGASAQANEAAAKISSPLRNARRAPYRSATRPASSSPPPKVSVYAPSTHCRSAGSNPRSRRMAGSAIATIVTSRTTTNCATQRSARRRPPRSWAPPEAFGAVTGFIL